MKTILYFLAVAALASVPAPAQINNPAATNGIQIVHVNGTSSYITASANTNAARGIQIYAAQTAAVSGDTIRVGPGVYDISVPVITAGTGLGKNGVNWFFYPGAEVYWEVDNDATSPDGGMWDDNNTAMTFAVEGSGSFVRLNFDENDDIAPAIVRVQNSASNINFKAALCHFTNNPLLDGNVFGVWQGGGTLVCDIDVLASDGADTGAVGVWWQGGTLSYRGHLLSANAEPIYGNVTGSGLNLNAYINADQIFHTLATGQTSVASHEGVVNGSGTDSTSALWVTANTVIAANGGTSVYAQPGGSIGNKLYVSAQKIFGPVATNSINTMLIYIDADKIAAIQNGTSGNDALLRLTSGVFRINIREYDPNGFTGNMINVSGGTQEIYMGGFQAVSGTLGLTQSSGSLRLRGMRIDTSANSSTNPITKSGGTLSIESGCVLVAATGLSSIQASTAQTVNVLSGAANTAVNSNVTQAVGSLTVSASVF